MARMVASRAASTASPPRRHASFALLQGDARALAGVAIGKKKASLGQSARIRSILIMAMPFGCCDLCLGPSMAPGRSRSRRPSRPSFPPRSSFSGSVIGVSTRACRQGPVQHFGKIHQHLWQPGLSYVSESSRRVRICGKQETSTPGSTLFRHPRDRGLCRKSCTHRIGPWSPSSPRVGHGLCQLLSGHSTGIPQSRATGGGAYHFRDSSRVQILLPKPREPSPAVCRPSSAKRDLNVTFLPLAPSTRSH